MSRNAEFRQPSRSRSVAPSTVTEDSIPWSHCPNCQHPLQFNPFFAAEDDYAKLLRRGVEQTRREKGDDHEGVLAHLTALAVHLEELGRPDEASTVTRERDALAPRVSARREREQGEREQQ